MMADRTEGSLLASMAKRIRALEKRQSLRAVPARIAREASWLGTRNLNDVIESGWHLQHLNVNATTGRNYPGGGGSAGHLEVTHGVGTPQVFTMQRYTDYQGRAVWVRANYGGTWYPWQNVSSGRTPPSLSLAASFVAAPINGSGTLVVEENGRFITLRGLVTGTFVANATTDILALPAGWRPINQWPAPAIFTNGEYNWGSISPGGVFSVRKTTSGTSTLVVGTTFLRAAP